MGVSERNANLHIIPRMQERSQYDNHYYSWSVLHVALYLLDYSNTLLLLRLVICGVIITKFGISLISHRRKCFNQFSKLAYWRSQRHVSSLHL